MKSPQPICFTLAAVFAFASSLALAQTPRMITGSAAGAPADLLARVVTDILREETGQNWITENRPGAGNRLAAMAVKDAAPDGNVLMLQPGGLLTVVPHTDQDARYNALRDFAVVASAASMDVGLAVSRKTNLSTMKEFIAWLRADPARATFATPGYGGIPHLFGLQFGKAIGVPMTNVPYKGGGPDMLRDIIGGHVLVASSVLSSFVNEHKRGDLRLLATSGETRSRFVPDVPTFKEQGFPDLVSTLWYGVFAPAATPMATIERLNLAINRGLKQPRQTERVTALGMEVVLSTPAALAKGMRAEYDAFGMLIRDFGIKPSPN